MEFLKRNWQVLVIILLVVFIFIANFFFFRLAMDLIIVFFALVALIFKKQKEFIRDWFPPLILFYLYEFLRGRANIIGDFLHRPLVDSALINVDKVLFGIGDKVPTVYFQYSMSNIQTGSFSPCWYDFVLFFFYTSFFWFWILAGFLAWIKSRSLFQRYMYGLVGFSLFDTLIYVFYPSAPPWYAAQEGLLPPLQRLMLSYDYFSTKYFSVVSAYGDNPFAAFPSHHAAWPFYSALFLIYMFGKKALPTLLIPLIIAFATWYGAEHYIIDSIAGFLIAFIAFLLAITDYSKLKKKLRFIV